MPVPLLTTKLFIPPVRPGIIPRPRLVERLNQGLGAGHKLTLISASAGFGKTTLVSEWIAGCGIPAAWISLDEGDSDPSMFLSYLVKALQTIEAGIGEGLLAALHASQPLQIEAILTTLLNEISIIPEQFVLILDDYHLIDSQVVDQSLAFLIEHQPPQMHLVITTREDPSLPLPRLRARGQLTELRAADLRFTFPEAADFLNQLIGLNLSVENIAALETRTEGWIAGLQLAALSIKGREDSDRFIQAFTGSHRYVLDYLVEEVLQRQSDYIHSFLLQTAILDRFCAPLCNAVTEREDGKEMLDVLEHSNLFLIPLDDERRWYRYHHLFADVLRAHLIEEQPDRVAILHQRASEWYEQNSLRSDAIRHALAAKDFECAAGLIELAWPATEDASIQLATWLGWVKKLPEELVRARPVLNVGYAFAILGVGELEAAESRLKDAEQWIEAADPIKVQGSTTPFDVVVVDKEQFKSLPAAIAVGRAYIAQAYGNISDTVRYASQVLELPEADPFRQSQASMLLGLTYWASGDLEAANRVFADYTIKLRAAGNIPDAISTTVVLADIRLGLGHLQEAIRTIEQLLQYVIDQGEPISPDTADLHRGLSELCLIQGDPQAAAQHLQRSKELGEKAELPVLRYRLYVAQARFYKTQGNLDEALALLDEAEHLYIRSPLPDSCPISAMKARIWVVQGRLIEAQRWVLERGLSVDDDLSYLDEFEHITLARILIAQYQNDRLDGPIQAAMELLERLLQAAEEGSRIGSVIEILVLQALALQAQGNITPALTPLERALTLAEPEGFVRIFVDEGEAMRSLLMGFKSSREIKTRQSLFSYMDKILLACAQPAEVTPQAAIQNQPPVIFSPLTDRELEILRLIADGQSNTQISQRLFLALSTIKGHNLHIFNKLQAENRTEAVARAREYGLI